MDTQFTNLTSSFEKPKRTDRRMDRPKAICPLNFSEDGGEDTGVRDGMVGGEAL